MWECHALKKIQMNTVLFTVVHLKITETFNKEEKSVLKIRDDPF